MAEKPGIALFQCQWCLFSPADQDWVDNHLPSNIYLTKTPCTGRINPLYVLNAIQVGADGVMIRGCLPEQCHFVTGNITARRQLEEFNDFLNHIGYEKQRVRFVWLDLQDRCMIQKELAAFEKELKCLGKAANLVTRMKVAEGEQNA